MRVLLTGMAGFIGYHLAKALLARGDTVVGVDDLNAYYAPKLKQDRLRQLGFMPEQFVLGGRFYSKSQPHCSFYYLDCADRAAIEAVFGQDGFDVVCHLAAQPGVGYSRENPSAYVQSNLVGFMQILECVRQINCKNFVYASSSSVYGANQSLPYYSQQSCEHPLSLYAATKKSAEMLAHSYSNCYAIPCTGLRFFTVYGPWGRPDMAPMRFMRRMLQSEPILVFNSGAMQRDFTYIDDVVAGCLHVLDQPAQSNPDWDASNPDPDSSSAPYRLYNIGNTKPVALMDFIDTMQQVLAVKAKLQLCPMQVGDVQATHADVTPLRQQFGYQPRTDLHTGLSATAQWYRDYYQLLIST